MGKSLASNKSLNPTKSSAKPLFKTLACAVVTFKEEIPEAFIKQLVSLGFSKKRTQKYSVSQILGIRNFYPEIIFIPELSEETTEQIRSKYPLIPFVSISEKPSHLSRSIISVLEKSELTSVPLESKKKLNVDLSYKALFDNPLAAILITKPDGSILECNQTALNLFGYSKEEILSKGRRLFIDHTDPEFHKNLEERLKKKRTVGTLKVRTKLGENLICSFSSSLFEGEDHVLYSSILITDITPRNVAIQELDKSEKRFKSLIQEASDIMSIIDESGNYVYVSPTAETVLKHSAENLMGKNALGFIHPEDLTKVEKALVNAKKQKRTRVLPFRYKDGNGQWQWIETIATNLLNEPNINGIVVNSRIVTEQIEMAQKLQNIMDSSLDIISTIDKYGSFVSVSKASEAILGYSPKEMEGKKLIDFVYEEDIDYTVLTAKTIIHGKKVTNFENRYVGKNGKIIPLMWSGYWNEEQNLMFAIARDGTEKQKTDEQFRLINEELRLSKEKFLYSLKATNETVWAFDISTEEISWSEGINRHYGYNPPDYKEQLAEWGEKIHPEDRKRVFLSFKNAIESKQENFWFEKYKFIKQTGEISHVLDRGYVIRNSDGTPKKIVGAMLDITENHKKSLEIEEKNQKLAEITWMQSHVVRAPVAKILGLIEILETTNDADQKEKALEFLKTSAMELDQVTRAIVRKAEKVRN
ncbi:MAG TPA: PAS domain S-box protein [Salinimicrobium sp.]|nr:PAS domain S-box protein [Salinimicrobium sp.]